MKTIPALFFALILASCGSNPDPSVVVIPNGTSELPPSTKPDTSPLHDGVTKTRGKIKDVQDSTKEVKAQVGEATKEGDELGKAIDRAYAEGITAGSTQAEELRSRVQSLLAKLKQAGEKIIALTQELGTLETMGDGLRDEVGKLTTDIRLAEHDIRLRDGKIKALEEQAVAYQAAVNQLSKQLDKSVEEGAKAKVYKTWVLWAVGIFAGYIMLRLLAKQFSWGFI